MSCASRFVDSGIVQSARDSFHEILSAKGGYCGTSTTVQAYDSSRVSLPDSQVSPVPLSKILRPELWEALRLDNILADDDLLDERRQSGEIDGINRYTDVVLRNDRVEYLAFLTRLHGCGLLGFSRTSKARVSPFS